MYIFQIEHFQKELQDLKSRSSGSKIVVGEKEESYQLKRQTENLADFWRDIRTTTKVYIYKSFSLLLNKINCLSVF